MTKLSIRNLLILFSFSLCSCETLQDFAGLSKPDLEEDLINQTPDLVLPPDFNKVARPESRMEKNQTIQSLNTAPIFPIESQSVTPRVTNYIAPQINVKSSPTPSDSLERFKENRSFSIGQWVYGQYVQGFKQGNLYYRPIYDKGYNFSRRYVPNQNISNFSNPSQVNREAFFNNKNSQNSDYQNFDNLPIID